jgi:transposase
MIKYSLGIDISMKSFYVCLSSIDALQHVNVVSSGNFTNNVSGFKLLHQWLEKHCKQKEVWLSIVMEATGVYYEQCAMFLFKEGYNIAVVLPNKAKKYLQSLGLKSKNDKIDAKGLSRMGAEQSLQLWQPMDDFFYQLRTLTRQHQNLQELKTSISNQQHAHEHSGTINKFVIKQLKQLIANIDKQIDAIGKAIEEHIISNVFIAKKVTDICVIKGLGILTVAVIIAETNGFILFKNARQLVSYAGYDVIENQSGNHIGKTKISKKGNSKIRRALHLPAFNVVRYKETPFVNLYKRTLSKHNIKMKSYVAVQKKLLIMIYSLWKKNEAYNSKVNQGESTRDIEQEATSRHGFEKTETKTEKRTQKNSADLKPALHKVINRRHVAV